MSEVLIPAGLNSTSGIRVEVNKHSPPFTDFLVRSNGSDTTCFISIPGTPNSTDPDPKSSPMCAEPNHSKKWFPLFPECNNFRFFRKKPLKTHWQAQLSSVDDETRSHQRCTDITLHSTSRRVCDITGRFVDIPRHPTASGGYGYVWRCNLINDASGAVTKVAAKSIKLEGSGSNDALRKFLKRGTRELDVWARLQHGHILPLYGVAHEFLPGITVMVSPWLENGPVTSFIGSHPDLSGSHRLQLVSDVADGLRYLHSQSIVHGDLTGSNVLICAQGRAHLADFGLSMLLTEPSTLSHSLTESAQWAAPELIELPTDNSINPWDLLSFQSDMYSFGSVMFHILSGVIPYHKLPNNRVVVAIMRGEKPPRPEHRQIIDEHWDFIQQCWLPAKERYTRPSADDAYKFMQKCRREHISALNAELDTDSWGL